MNKERFVQSYIEQQRAYLSAYGPIDDQCPALQGTPVQKTDNRFGFDTPVLRPRKPCSPQKSDGGDTFDKHAACHTDSNKENEPTRKKLPGRAKRKKTPSDVERLARLTERRERKRQKREIVKSPRKSPKDKAKKKTHALTPAAFALMHGFSASNVRKDRLILQSGHLGVFSKGKASIKAKVSSKKSAPTPVVFSELAFLNKPSHQVTTAEDDERSERSGPSTSGRSSRPQSDKVDVTDGQIPPKEDNEGQASSAPLGQTQGPLARPQSIVWDIESQNDCLSDPVQSDAGLAATSIALNLLSSHWFALPGPGKMDEQAIHSKPSPPQPIRMSSRSHSLPEVRERCNSGGDDQSTSLHPSHSASQGGYRQQCHSPERVTLLHSRPSISRLVAPSPVPDAVEAPHVQVLGIPDGELDIGRVQTGILPFVDSFLEVPRSISAYHMEPPEIPSGINDNHVNETCRQPARTCARPFHFRSPAAQLREATSSVSFENDALEYYQTTGEQEHFSDLSYDPNNCPPFDWLSFCDPVAPRYEGESVGVVNDFGTAHDIDFARDLDVPDDYDYDYVGELNLRDFEQNVAGGHELEHGYGSEYGTVEDIDYFESQYDDPNASGDEVDFHESDQGELQNVITVDEDPEDDQPLAPALFEGRALLLGFSTSIGRQRSGLSDAEVDVAKRLHSHWRPQKL